jgi:hypothetical protein
MSFDEFKEKLTASIELFLATEKSLFITYKDKLREEGISHQLACKMAAAFKEFDVDCEYSRQPDGNEKQNDSGKKVRPDIIIHRRGKNDDNLAVIEVKWGKNPENDSTKIPEYSNLHYKYGVEVRFDENGNVKCCQIYDFSSKKWKVCFDA